MIDKIEYKYTPKSGVVDEVVQLNAAKDVVINQFDENTKPLISFGPPRNKPGGAYEGMSGDYKEFDVLNDNTLIGYLFCFIDDSKRNFRAFTLPKV